ncbi:hypothetical protein SLA2020_455730 [Shorea laevis]
MSALGFQPNVITYGTIIDALCKGNLEEAKGLLIEMVEGGVQPNVVTFTILIDTACKQQRLRDAIQFFDLMIQKVIILIW